MPSFRQVLYSVDSMPACYTCGQPLLSIQCSWPVHQFVMATDFSRYGVMAGTAEQRIGFFLPDTFAMLPFVSALEPLRAANRYSSKHLYSWHLFGESSSPAYANNAMQQIVEGPLDSAADLDRLIICGPHDPHQYNNESCYRVLKKIASSGTRMGALDTGSYLLAKSRLIGNHRCTIHWENLPGFIEEFPTLNVLVRAV